MISTRNSEGYADPTAYLALTAVMGGVERRANTMRTQDSYRPLVYLCSPLAVDIAGNMQKARGFCRFALEHGAIPIAPHLLFPQFLNDADEEQCALGLFMGCVLMTKCAEVWVFGESFSEGMMMEIERAENRGMTVRYFTSGCEEVGA